MCPHLQKNIAQLINAYQYKTDAYMYISMALVTYPLDANTSDYHGDKSYKTTKNNGLD